MGAEVALGLVVSIAGIGISFYAGRGARQQRKEQRSIEQFLARQRDLRIFSARLRAAARDYHSALLVPGLPAISKINWLPKAPIDLMNVSCSLDVHTKTHIDSRQQKLTAAYLPQPSSRTRIPRYHEMVDVHDRPDHWFDATCYRLVALPSVNDDVVVLPIGLTTYWEGFDSCEGLALEAVEMLGKSRNRAVGGPLRRYLRDPLILSNRNCTIGFTTLTVRRSLDGTASFFVHRRNSRVATGGNLTNLIPAGEFQPSDDSNYSTLNEANVWLAIMREYAEEFLGVDEVRSRNGAPIDYKGHSAV